MTRLHPFRICPLAAALLLAAGPASAGEVLATGIFDGRSGHTVSGSVSVVATDGGHRLVLHDDFRLDRAPDPRLALGRDGYDADTQFTRLNRDSGRQVHVLPATIEPGAYNEVWLWCEAFSVPLGVARLERTQ